MCMALQSFYCTEKAQHIVKTARVCGADAAANVPRY